MTRPPFVSVLAWLIIVACGFSLLIGGAQALLMVFGFGLESDGALKFLAGVGAYSTLSLVGICAGIGMLRLRNWARILTVILLSIGIAWQFVGFILMRKMEAEAGFPTDDPKFDSMTTMIKSITAVFSVVVASMCAFCIYKLSRPEIKRAFGV